MNCVRLFQIAERRTANIFKFTSVKHISGHQLQYMETQDRWRERDGIPKQWQLIYKTSMDKYLKIGATYITVSSSIITCASAFYGVFMFDSTHMDTPVILGTDVVIANNVYEALAYLGAYIALHIAMKVVISRLVVRLYQNGDRYIAVFRGNWYDSIQKHEFHLKNVKKLTPKLPIAWNDSRYVIGNKQAIMFDIHFKTPEYLNYLRGDTAECPEDDDF